MSSWQSSTFFGTLYPSSFVTDIQVPDGLCETQRLPANKAPDAAAWCRVLPSASRHRSVPFLTLSEGVGCCTELPAPRAGLLCWPRISPSRKLQGW
ncbi:hypothetical protein CCMA1212_000721 [Trichoderma ghanense]|uniref:Uncharacterized protein n=1 Tax=Trichoderma ghanense TaxID=65468 RepID=A0ABY2HJH6_9HYPO